MSAVVVGSVVRVGQKYVMADEAPYEGRGHFEDDDLTGTKWRVVGLRQPYNGGKCALLAPLGSSTAEEWEYDVSVSRLEVVNG